MDALLTRAQEALLLAVMLSLPLLIAALIVGVLVSIFQAATQIQDATLAHLPRLLAVAVCLAAFGPWIARHIAGFATRIFAGGLAGLQGSVPVSLLANGSGASRRPHPPDPPLPAGQRGEEQQRLEQESKQRRPRRASTNARDPSGSPLCPAGRGGSGG